MTDAERLEAIIQKLFEARYMWGIDYLTWRSTTALTVGMNDLYSVTVEQPITVGKLADALTECYDKVVKYNSPRGGGDD